MMHHQHLKKKKKKKRGVRQIMGKGSLEKHRMTATEELTEPTT